MADLSQTISNSLNLFGPAPSNKWNAYNWNAFVWGEGTADLAVTALKVLSESLTLSDSINKSQAHVIENTLSPTSDVSLIYHRDSAGYFHVFPGGVTDGDDRVASTWSNGTSTSATWVASSTTSTTWSAA